MFLSLDGTFFVQLINFAIFFAILNVVFLRPVQRAISKRREYIDSLTTDYDRAQAEANALRSQAEAIHADARREADRLLAEARANAGNEAANVASDANARVAQIVESAHAQVEGELAGVRAREEQLAADLASSIVGKVLTEPAR
jgi:F-type H+-transporting ATPase subunit b